MMLRGVVGIVLWLAVYAGVGAGAYYLWFAPEQQNAGASKPRSETVWDIRVETVKLSDYALKRRLNGRVQYAQVQSLAFNTSGCIDYAKPDLRAGSVVKNGDVLARLESGKAALRLDAAKQEKLLTDAQRLEVVATLTVAQTRSARATDQVNVTEQKLERQRRLFDRGLLSQTAMEQLEQELVDVRNKSDAASEEVTIAQSKMGALKARSVQAEIAIRQAEYDLTGLELRAPGDGVVVSEKLSGTTCIGAFVPLVEIGDEARKVVEAEVSYLVLDAISKDGDVVGRDVEFGRPFEDCEAAVSKVAGASDTRNLTVLRIELDAACSARVSNNQAISFQLDSEIFRNSVRLAASVEWDAGTVFVVDDGRLRQRSVEISGRDENWIYITKGLAAGEQVLSSRPEFAIDGQLVRVIQK